MMLPAPLGCSKDKVSFEHYENYDSRYLLNNCKLLCVGGLKVKHYVETCRSEVSS
jgi:hypothetical protein